MKNFPKTISGISEIYDKYDLFIFDLWGVLHEGVYVFKEALDVLKKLKDKHVFILSNAPRHKEKAVKRLEDLGIARNLYFDIHTSGTDCFNSLKERSIDPYKSLGTTFFSLGPSKDNDLLEGLEYKRVDEVKDASFILAVGVLTKEINERVLDYGIKHNLPLICANSDHLVIHKGEFELCSGALAHIYENKGGQVAWHGKPEKKMFDVALQIFPEISRKKTIMIGDSLRTDIKGANNSSIDSLLVLSKGIHKESALNIESKAKEAFKEYDSIPTFMINEVIW